MVAPVYSTDLVDIDLAESTASWLAIGSASLGSSPSFSMQGTNAVDRATTAASSRGAVFNNGSPIVLAADEHVFQWVFTASPGVTDTIANGGLSIVMGSTASTYVRFHVDGSDTFGGGGRTGKCYPVFYDNTASAVSPYRTLVGSPPSDPTVFGAWLNTTANGRMGVDAMRRGTGGYIVDGDSGNPATFQGFSDEGDLVANRWGVLTPVVGIFELQGKFAIGQNTSKVAAACYFKDSDRLVVIGENPHVLSTFNEIIIDHATTTCVWNNISIKSLSTTSRCDLTITVNNPSFTVDGGTYDSIGVTTLQSNSTISSVSWNTCDRIVQNLASIADCTVSNTIASSAINVDDLSLITGCTFNSGGTGHAIDLGTISSTISKSWDNTDSGYATVDGSTGNETILVSVDSGITLTINASTGSSTPTVNNTGLGTVIVSAPKPKIEFTINPVLTNYEYRVYDVTARGSLAGAVEVQGVETTSLATHTYNYDYVAGKVYAVQILPHANDYEESVIYFDAKQTDQFVTLELIKDENN